MKVIKSADKLEETKGECNEFTYSLFKYLSNLKDKNTATRKLRLGLLVDYFISFHSLSRVIKQNPQIVAENSNIPVYIMNYLIETFTEVTPNQFDSVQYVKTPRLQLKLIFYIIVSSLIAFEYSFNIIPLAKAMKVELKQMIQYCREVGCSVDERKIKDDIVTVTLKAPLTIRTDKFAKK